MEVCKALLAGQWRSLPTSGAPSIARLASGLSPFVPSNARRSKLTHYRWVASLDFAEASPHFRSAATLVFKPVLRTIL